jgi:ankyrin repeat protein
MNQHKTLAYKPSIYVEMMREISHGNDVARLKGLIKNKVMDNKQLSQSLVISSRIGSVAVTRILIDSGADIDYSYGALGETPIVEAILERHTDVVKTLLEMGADVSIPEYGEISHPLAIAAELGDLEIVKLLLEFGADVNQIHKGTGESAIWAAAGSGQEEVFNYLSVLSDPKLRDEAAEILACGIWERKIRKNADPQVVELTSAVLNNDLAGVLKIIAEGVDVNGVNDVGSTPLLLASCHDNYPIMEVLLQAGADPNLVIKSEECEDFDDGTTNLMRVSSKETCLLLLNHGADVNAKNDQGKTALMIAAKHSNTGLIEALLQRNADSKLLDNQNKTALDIAKDNNDEVIISLLSSAEG